MPEALPDAAQQERGRERLPVAAEEAAAEDPAEAEDMLPAAPGYAAEDRPAEEVEDRA